MSEKDKQQGTIKTEVEVHGSKHQSTLKLNSIVYSNLDGMKRNEVLGIFRSIEKQHTIS